MKEIEKIKQADIDFLSHQTDYEKFKENIRSTAFNVLFVPHNSEEIKLAYKSRYNNKRKNNVVLLMINEKAKNCYYFAVKNLLELYSLGQLRVKKEAIINGDNCFQNVLNDGLNYQNIEKDRQRIAKIKSYISNYNWNGTEFPAGPKDWKQFRQNNKTIALNVLFVPHNTETIMVAYRSEYNNKREKQVNLLILLLSPD